MLTLVQKHLLRDFESRCDVSFLNYYPLQQVSTSLNKARLRPNEAQGGRKNFAPVLGHRSGGIRQEKCTS